MSAKVYVLLDLVHSNSLKVTRILREKPGVAVVDVLEGPPDIIMAIEAAERQKAAQYLMNALNSVDGMTENLRVLPVRKSPGKKYRRNQETSNDVTEKSKKEVASYV
jgi:hypothetical protein